MSSPAIALSLPCSSEAPRLARTAVAQLKGIDSVRDDAVLVVSELVTNAVLHSGTAPDDPITLRVRCEPDHLKICVRDAGKSGRSPRPRTDGADGQGGFGLVLVEQIADSWATRFDTGRVVSARIGFPPVSDATAAT